jgi:hypothetical protein
LTEDTNTIITTLFDTIYIVDNLTFVLEATEKEIVSFPINITCSPTDVGPTTYVLTSEEDSSIDSWTSIDLDMSTLEINPAPACDEDTLYKISIESATDTFTGYKDIELTIKSTSKSTIDPLIPLATYGTAVEIAAGTAGGSSILNDSAPILIWILINGM